MNVKTLRLFAIALLASLTPLASGLAQEFNALPNITFAAVRSAESLGVPKVIGVAFDEKSAGDKDEVAVLDHVLKYLSVQSFDTQEQATADMKRVSDLLTKHGYFIIASGVYGSNSYEIDYVPPSRFFTIGHHDYSSHTTGDAGNLVWASAAAANAALSSAVKSLQDAGYIVLQAAVVPDNLAAGQSSIALTFSAALQ